MINEGIENIVTLETIDKYVSRFIKESKEISCRSIGFSPNDKYQFHDFVRKFIDKTIIMPSRFKGMDFYEDFGGKYDIKTDIGYVLMFDLFIPNFYKVELLKILCGMEELGCNEFECLTFNSNDYREEDKDDRFCRYEVYREYRLADYFEGAHEFTDSKLLLEVADYFENVISKPNPHLEVLENIEWGFMEIVDAGHLTLQSAVAWRKDMIDYVLCNNSRTSQSNLILN